MGSDRSTVPSLAQVDDGNIQIHVPRAEFGEFIQGLLSQPRSLQRTETRFFDIDHNFIRHLNEVIKQRVQTQQHAQLVSFASSIYFSDSRIQTLSSWEALDTFVDNS